MRAILALAIASTLVTLPLAAQKPAAKPARMETPCPLHLTDLALTPAQDSAFKAIRAAHRAEMQAMHASMGAGHGAMQPAGAMKHDSAMHAAMHPAAGAMKHDSAQHAAMHPAASGMKHDSAMHAAMHPAAGAMKGDSATRAMHVAMHAQMKAAMQRSYEAARAVLTDAQRARFDAAAAAHDKEMEARMASGGAHQCGDCCADHGAQGMKREP